MSKATPAAFVVGSPRSGTTILAEILGQHPQIAKWYEPYFIWDWYLGMRSTDIREAWEATEKVKSFIRGEFEYFKRRSKRDLVVDKSPEHSFHIPFVNEVFPTALWIHILRDGRDVTLSIHKEWRKRSLIVQKRDFVSFIKVVLTMLSRQPYFRHKLKALFFELRHADLANPIGLLNKSKWHGQVGWGPRFQGWEEVLKTHSVLQFNAYQWLHSVDKIYEDLRFISPDRVLEIRYEDLVTKPKPTLLEILDFLKMSLPGDFFEWIPKLKKGNFNKWKTGFSAEQLKEIWPILNDRLFELKYENDPDWAERNTHQEDIRWGKSTEMEA